MKLINKKFIGGLSVLCICVLVFVFINTRDKQALPNSEELEGKVFDLHNVLNENFEKFTIHIHPHAKDEESAIKMAKDFSKMVNGVVEPLRTLDDNVDTSSIGLDYKEEQQIESIRGRFWYKVE